MNKQETGGELAANLWFDDWRDRMAVELTREQRWHDEVRELFREYFGKEDSDHKRRAYSLYNRSREVKAGRAKEIRDAAKRLSGTAAASLRKVAKALETSSNDVSDLLLEIEVADEGQEKQIGEGSDEKWVRMRKADSKKYYDVTFSALKKRKHFRMKSIEGTNDVLIHPDDWKDRFLKK